MLLAFPSLLVLLILILHSFRSLPRARAAAFWIGVAVYGLLRGAAVRWISQHGLGGSFPYIIQDPIASLAGVSLQEVAGWAIVLYLGWWTGARLAPRLFLQLTLAGVFLACSSLAVESAAIAAGWWRWTVPVPESSWGGVPFIGIVDWFFTSTDFLLPMLALSAPALRGHPARYLSLLAFPVHFAAHLFVQRPGRALPIPPHHLAHWLLLGVMVWLAMRSRVEDRPFHGASRDTWERLPAAAIAIVLAVLAAADLAVAARPALLTALLPLAAIALAGTLPIRLIVPAARGRVMPLALACILAIAAFGIHAAAARRQEDLAQRLQRAVALRDGGDLESAERALEGILKDHPGQHVPRAILGEMRYRAGQLEGARRLFESATRVQQNYADGFRYLAVIDLRLGRSESAADWAGRGLEIQPEDPQLLYLRARARGTPSEFVQERIGALGPRRAFGLVSLAFEVDDLDSAASLLEAALALWPKVGSFHAGKVRLALARGRPDEAGEAVKEWLRRLPDDPEARTAERALGVAQPSLPHDP